MREISNFDKIVHFSQNSELSFGPKTPACFDPLCLDFDSSLTSIESKKTKKSFSFVIVKKQKLFSA